ncbi:AlpA family phage regulatory protein [Ruegeria sp. 2205SS24-7]|uniref:helix-turn-helix transcriptional regulator n=1 Tax=Ruegeria discodermiae TaxID=3064389 RepID=UPI0027428A21|nr:AlpA family phage regulatory protein [Ruegeria sp. 2205SS24-7]MDP5217148.1 AlpA family phage regulatory protein [Ruegeria sp. 2205SS24-7]
MNLLSFNDLQNKLGGRSRSSVYRDIETGRLPKPIKFGARLYWKEADIDAAIDAQAA